MTDEYWEEKSVRNLGLSLYWFYLSIATHFEGDEGIRNAFQYFLGGEGRELFPFNLVTTVLK